MRLLTTKFLPETYASNGYLAAALVGFYLACEVRGIGVGVGTGALPLASCLRVAST